MDRYVLYRFLRVPLILAQLLLSIILSTAPVSAGTSQTPYLLPWQAGQTYECIQGNNSVADHRGIEAYAWDFPMPTGTLILAARAGTVTMVKDDSNIAGFNITYASDANYVVINHGDGTQALYLHIMKDGALVHVGEQVAQGQPIARSGDTGWTSGPHLHFVVEHASSTDHLTQSISVSFRDVNDWGGIPQPGRWYTSQNFLHPPTPSLPPLIYSHRITPIQAIAISTEGAKQDYDIPYGHFFKEANGRGGQGITGYIVTDDYHIPFWTKFPSLGGVAMLGYPIGDRFTFDGFVVQPFQKAVLQWNPATKSFAFLNVLDL
ncbi:MAG: M23 family metallopeptidase, partial [Chloroflexi bacterium]|nr:M23 family metallopeptidase [Chloroflexota bacterium]